MKRIKIKQIKEFFAFLGTYILSLLGWGPFRWEGMQKVNKRPVLLIHGYLNSSFVWFYHGQKLVKEGFGPIYTINLGWPFSSIEKYVKVVDAKVKEIKKESKQKNIVIIGHSMGGLVGAYYALHTKTINVTDVIAMGTPFKGTKAAFFAPGRCAKQMRIGSLFLQSLTEKITSQNKQKYYCIATKTDHIVFPYDSALLNHDPHLMHLYNDIGHASLLFSSKVHKKILSWLNKIEEERKS